MEIRTIIAALLFVYAFYIAMRHNLHMFQLNGYKNGEHFNRMKKNLRQQWLLMAGMLLGVIRIFISSVFLDIPIFFVLIMTILVYRALRRLNNKKKLVYTARVKRLIATDLCLAAICIAAAFFIAGIKPLTGIFALLTGLQIFMLIICNIINHPIESAINRHYINDAKKRLKEAEGLKILGVTGSYGKTSVKFYLKTLLEEHYRVLVTPESYNTPMGIVKTIRGSLKPTDEIFVCEMGARHVGDIKEICDIVHPDHGLITSIGPQHLETFFNMENIKNTKFELADALPKDGILFLNGDNAYINDKEEKYDNKVFYRTGEGEGYTAKDIRVSQTGTEFTVLAPSGASEKFSTRLVGEHNVINILGAIAVANTFNIPLKDLKVPVRRLAPVPHRMELKEHGDVTIIDDAYNSNPIGSKAAVETLKLFPGVRILITPGMVELGDEEEKYNYEFGGYAAGCCDHILLVGKKRTEPIRKGALDAGFDEAKIRSYDNVQDAINYAYNIGAAGHKYILLENDLPDNY